jgi:predicted SnoaL-like aldol condensation-catalyzing enzyme
MTGGIVMSRRIDNAMGLYLEGIRDGRPREAVTRYTGDRYTQHSTGVRDGRDGFVEFFEPFIGRNPVRDIRVIRALEDGRYVFLHVYQSLNDGQTEWVTTDFFDTDADERIVEHWDVIAPYAAHTPAGHTSIDGPTEISDLDRTDDNKAIVRGLITHVLMEGTDQDDIDRYISAETYIQHNAKVEDGLGPFRSLVLAPDRSLVYDEIVLLVGQGDFVATLCRARWEDEEQAQVDIFRLEDGLIVEHWDNTEPVPPADGWVNSGKF